MSGPLWDGWSLRVGPDIMVTMFAAHQSTEALQEAVRLGDREHLETSVSDSMIWVMASPESQRGKQEWIDASCSVTWHWFKVAVRRSLELDNACVVESWISQSRDPVAGEDDSQPVVAAGVVLDVWANEGGTWRLVARYPQRAGD